MAMPMTRAAPNRPLLGIGTVRHHRLRPRDHAFAYPTWFVLLPLRALRQLPDPALARNRRAWASFHDRDHGDGSDDCLAWLDGWLLRQGIHDALGEVWLHTYPRVLGFVFKPVSFWYCHRLDGSLAAVVAEVNNTFGGRHLYLLDGPALAFGREIEATKAFHVSPFCQVEGRYRFRFMRTDLGAGPHAAAQAGHHSAAQAGHHNAAQADHHSAAQADHHKAAQAGRHQAGQAGHDDAAAIGRTVARIDYDDAEGPLLTTSVSGRLQPLTAASLRGALARMPLLTLGVIARIHWQALRLLALRVPFIGRRPDHGGHPTPPSPRGTT